MKLTTAKLKQMIKEELMEMERNDPYADPGAKRDRNRGKWLLDREYIENLANMLGAQFHNEQDSLTSTSWGGITQISYRVTPPGSFDDIQILTIDLFKAKRLRHQKTHDAYFTVTDAEDKTYTKTLDFTLSGDINTDAEFIDILRTKAMNEIWKLSRMGDAWVNHVMPGYNKG